MKNRNLFTTTVVTVVLTITCLLGGKPNAIARPATHRATAATETFELAPTGKTRALSLKVGEKVRIAFTSGHGKRVAKHVTVLGKHTKHHHHAKSSATASTSATTTTAVHHHKHHYHHVTGVVTAVSGHSVTIKVAHRHHRA